MAKKGQPRRQKRLSVSPARKLLRKEAIWTIRQKPGPHTSVNSIPLGFVVRDLLGLARTLREAKHIINAGNVLVDNISRKKYQFAAGLFDTISIPIIGKKYRILLDKKGRLIIKEIEEKMADIKPSKIVGKKIVQGNKLMIQTHDGKTYHGIGNELRVGDSVLVDIQTKKILSHLSLKQGSNVYVIGGTHVGEVAAIENILEGTMKRDKLVDLKEKNESFQTTARNIMVVDEETANWIRKAFEERGEAE